MSSSGARLVSTAEAIDQTASGRLLHGIVASIAEFYSQNLATEVMKGMRLKAVNGGTPGRAPLGYLNVHTTAPGRTDIRTVAIDPDRAQHITWAFQAYSTGEWSAARIAAELNRRGVTTRPGPNRPGQPLTFRSVHYLLRKPLLQGPRRLRRRRTPRRTSAVDRPGDLGGRSGRARRPPQRRTRTRAPPLPQGHRLLP
ncbi:recombinase family protein [Raineyella sp. W15-4]|uniref:recombinase family protein n=1 Tax=Raineyella sp. W15-4 TaxID=3081651 RepID=UPI003989905E